MIVSEKFKNLIIPLFFLLCSFFYFIYINNFSSGFTYPLDDPYIHLSISENLTNNFIWGINGGGYSASTSSPVWTAILSSLSFFPINTLYLPLIINIVFCLIIIIFLQKTFINKIIPFSIIFLTPLIPLAFTGMEHVVQAFIAIYFFMLLANKDEMKLKLSSYLLMALAGGIRYEFLFFAFLFGVFYCIKSRTIKPFFLITLSVSIIPIFIGILNKANGWDFLPSGVLLKGNSNFISNPFNFLSSGLITFFSTPHIFIPLSVFFSYLLFLFFKNQNKLQRVDIVLFGFLLSLSIFHLFFAQKAWFYRYETYLIPLIILFAFIIFKKNHRWISFIILLPLLIRSFSAHRDLIVASKNIHDQQKQLSLFLTRFPGHNVLINDAGLMTWKTGIKFHDFYGIGTLFFYKSAKNKIWNIEDTEKYILENNITLAVIYKDWFTYRFGSIPADWDLIGVQKISGNIICGNSSVYIYVLPAGKQFLKDYIDTCKKILPETCAPIFR